MKILIIGGTYFLGKAFLEVCDKAGNEITVLNRGNREVPGNEDGHIRVIHANRQNAEELARIVAKFDPEGYDYVVDFCAYECGDIRKVLEALETSRSATRDSVEALETSRSATRDSVEALETSRNATRDSVETLETSRSATVGGVKVSSVQRKVEAGKRDHGVRQYVYISTCDVYRRGTGALLGEDSPLEERDFGGPEGAYICGKVALEKELRQCAEVSNNGEGDRMHYTSVRPAFIYGPENYAPRESVFFQWVSKAGQILFPEDADGTFQMIYVKDLARCIYACLGNEDFYDCAVNACGEKMDYQLFADAIEEATGQKIEKVMISVADVLNRKIPLPFPLSKAESETYDGGKMKKLGVEETPFVYGLRETYAWFTKHKAEGVRT